MNLCAFVTSFTRGSDHPQQLKTKGLRKDWLLSGKKNTYKTKNDNILW